MTEQQVARSLQIVVHGTPAPQGSKRAFVVAGRAVVTDANAKTKPWRQDVAAAARQAAEAQWWEAPTGPVMVTIGLRMPRPKYHYGAGRNAATLKPTAPHWCDKRPDRDKLQRAICDALTAAGVIRDDAQIVAGDTHKTYAPTPDRVGATITISSLTPTSPRTHGVVL